MELQFFERDDDFDVIQRALPHWAQTGTLVFVTFRTADSMPTAVVQKWHDERDLWLRQHHIDPSQDDWRLRIGKLEPSKQQEFQRRFSSQWHDQLDQCHGECALRDAKLAKIVADSLLYFDDERYELTDFVVMPNHVHLMGAFTSSAGMLTQCESWKHFTATRINAVLNRRGRFWQQDGFDHLIRSDRQFEYYREYIALNPAKAKLKPGEYVHWSRDLEGGASRS